MIQVREVFQLHFGRAREAIALAQEGAAIEARHGMPPSRILTDLTGEYYTLVLEADYPDLASFEKTLQDSLQAPEFREWYPKFAALCRGGRREIYRVHDVPARPKLDAAMVGETAVGG